MKIKIEKYVVPLCGNPVKEGAGTMGQLVLRLGLDLENGDLYVRSAKYKGVRESLDGGAFKFLSEDLKIRECVEGEVEVECA